MSQQHFVTDKCEKLWQNNVNGRCVCHHFISNGSQFRDFGRNIAFRIYKHVKFLKDFSVFDFDSTNLNNFTFIRRQTGGFYIKRHHFIQKSHIGTVARYCPGCVIHKVSLYAVYDFHTAFFGRQHGFRVALYISVIRNGNGRMSPFMSRFHSYIWRNQSIHSRHIRVQVQFHTLFFGFILSPNLRNFRNRVVMKSQILVSFFFSDFKLGISFDSKNGSVVNRFRQFIGRVHV